MNDETRQEEKETTKDETEPTKPEEAGSKDEVSKKSPIEQAEKQIAEMKLQNEEKSKLLDREEKLEASRRLGGSTQAGKPAEKPKEETPTEYAKRIMKGEI